MNLNNQTPDPTSIRFHEHCRTNNGEHVLANQRMREKKVLFKKETRNDSLIGSFPSQSILPCSFGKCWIKKTKLFPRIDTTRRENHVNREETRNYHDVLKMIIPEVIPEVLLNLILLNLILLNKLISLVFCAC